MSSSVSRKLPFRGKCYLARSTFPALSVRLEGGWRHHPTPAPTLQSTVSIHLRSFDNHLPTDLPLPKIPFPANMAISKAHDSMQPSPEPAAGFDSLVASINKILGPSNGIDSAGVNVQDLQDAMLSYSSCEDDWSKYALSDPSRAYTRNLVDNCNGKSNLLILVWSPGKSSPIHDHANAHCVMKVLKGTLKETLYGWPCQRADNPAACAKGPQHSEGDCPSTEHTCSAGSDVFEPAALQVQRDTAYGHDQVAYMSDKLGLHRITNPSSSEAAVSLHLYTVRHLASLHMSCVSKPNIDIAHSRQTQPSTAATFSTPRQARRAKWANAASTLSSA